jgi:Polysaccharide deacetylase
LELIFDSIVLLESEQRGSMLFTSSWDDGHPADLRLADLLATHGFPATFYVPITNREGRPVLQGAGLRQLSNFGEVGSHTHSHVFANAVPLAKWREELFFGKTALEQTLGNAVRGFCYPGGKRVAGAMELVREAGFQYARTTENFRLDAGVERFLLPTTLQFFPHRRDVLAHNFVKAGHYRSRVATFARALLQKSLETRLLRVLEFACGQERAVLHLWGHSWELQDQQLWGQLEKFLRIAATMVCVKDRLTNRDLVERLIPSS